MEEEPFVTHCWTINGVHIHLVLDQSGLEVFVEEGDEMVCDNARLSWPQLEAEKAQVTPQP